MAGQPAFVRQVAVRDYQPGIVTEAGDLVARAGFNGEAVLMMACSDGDGRRRRLRLGAWGGRAAGAAPRRVPAAGLNGERVVMVAAGFVHTVALSEAGHFFTWGCGECGQLGHDDEEDQLAPRQVEAGRFGVETGVFDAAGSAHTVAVTAVGRLYTWGDGEHGQLSWPEEDQDES